MLCAGSWRQRFKRCRTYRCRAGNFKRPSVRLTQRPTRTNRLTSVVQNHARHMAGRGENWPQVAGAIQKVTLIGTSRKLSVFPTKTAFFTMKVPPICHWAEAELNRRHTDFQSVALPTELPALAPWVFAADSRDGDTTRNKIDTPPIGVKMYFRPQSAWAASASSIRNALISSICWLRPTQACTPSCNRRMMALPTITPSAI